MEKDLPFDKIIRLTKPIITRFLRIFVVEVNDVTENINAVSMFRVTIHGCDTEKVITGDTFTDTGVTNLELDSNLSLTRPPRSKESAYCMKDATVFGNDIINYRHFIVDTVNSNIIYYCDRSPYRPGMHCYTTLTTSSTTATG